MEKVITLKSPLRAELKGKPVPRPYVARLVDRGGPWGVVFQPGEVFADGRTNWLGGWYLWTLLKPPGPGDRLWLDFGQGWELIGVEEALQEALSYVQIKFKED